MTRRFMPLLLVLALLGAGCTLQTAGAPTGQVSLTATFDDVGHLVAGHAVRVADVQVGSVIDVGLEGHRALVTMSILDQYPVPVGTTASIGQTSFLGENYVRLEFPPSFDPDHGPFVASGTQLESSTLGADLEAVSERALDLLAAVTANDVESIIDALAAGLGGRGQQLAGLTQDMELLLASFADGEADLAAIIDGLGGFGADLADGVGTIEDVIDRVVETVQMVDGRSDDMVATVESMTRLAADLNDYVLDPHLDKMITLIGELEQIITTIALEEEVVDRLIGDLVTFATKLPQSAHREAIFLYVWLTGISQGNPSPTPGAGR